MKFKIDFNHKEDDYFLIDVLGAELENVGDDKYSTLDRLVIEVRNFEHLEEVLNVVDKHYNDFYSAVISFNPPTIYLDSKC
jgi:hypothetical protein